jgi:hypothetical protein
VSRLAVVFKLDKTGFNLVRGVALLAVMLVTLAVLHLVNQEKYFLAVVFAELFTGVSDPGGEYGYRMSHLAVFGGAGTLLTALGFGIGGDAWGWVVLAAAVVTLLGGLAVRFGMHRFVASLLLNIWFVIVLSVQAGYSQEHVHVSPWAEALAWLIGSAVTLAVLNVLWLARGRTAQAQPVADLFPGDTKPVPLTRPVILFAVIRAVAVALAAGIAFGLHQPNADWMPVSAIAAMKPSLEQSALAAEQRLAGTIVGAVVAAVFLLAVDTKIVLEAVIVVLGALAGAIRGVSYAWYCAAVAGAVLIGLDLPHPSNLADEGRRILFTFIGVGIAVLVMFLASQLAKRTPGTAQPQPAAPAGASG